MQIDWITVAAQIVNFLILVWLLQRFLYAPITDAMRRREARIETRLSEAEAARAQAEDEARKLRDQQDALEDRKARILEDTRAEAEDLRDRLSADIREEMEGKRALWQDHLAEERDGLVATLQQQAGTKVIDITTRLLAEYSDTDSAEAVVARCVARLKDLDGKDRDRLVQAAEAGGGPARVETASSIDSAARGRITRALREALGTGLEVTYLEDRALVLGVRLTIGDQTVEWSARRYLERLGSELGAAIDEGAGRGDRDRQDDDTGAKVRPQAPGAKA